MKAAAPRMKGQARGKGEGGLHLHLCRFILPITKVCPYLQTQRLLVLGGENMVVCYTVLWIFWFTLFSVMQQGGLAAGGLPQGSRRSAALSPALDHSAFCRIRVPLRDPER